MEDVENFLKSKYGKLGEGLTEDKENHNGTLGQLKAIREKMKNNWKNIFRNCQRILHPKGDRS